MKLFVKNPRENRESRFLLGFLRQLKHLNLHKKIPILIFTFIVDAEGGS